MESGGSNLLLLPGNRFFVCYPEGLSPREAGKQNETSLVNEAFRLFKFIHIVYELL
ncbi:MAG: hypothetical protein K0R24_2338 [Gammaproteobacteria bacterium]|nr:hypothetical protein [Gammaproteobacteria bacterium]